MRPMIICWLLALTSTMSALAQKKISVESSLNEAIVFLSGAQVFRTGEFNAPEGISTLIFSGVSAQIDAYNITAQSNDKYMILEVRHHIEHIKPEVTDFSDTSKSIEIELQTMDDALVYSSLELDLLKVDIQNLTREKEMILKNKLMVGARSDSLNLIKNAIVFFHDKLKEIDKSIYKVKMAKYKKEKEIGKLEKRHQELRQFKIKTKAQTSPAKDVHEVHVTIMTQSTVSSALTISYLVSNAGWYPSYDIRAKSTNDPIELTYKANVFQNSGEDWEKVKLTLSTYNQHCKTSKPVLSPWFINYFNEYDQRDAKSAQLSNWRANVAEPITFANTGYSTIIPGKARQKNIPPVYSLSRESYSNVEFELDRPSSILSNGEQVLMVVDSKTIKADFYHYILPKINRDAFLLAKIADWEKLNLLKADANIYYDRTYVGQTVIDPLVLSDTIEIALGRDKGIFCTRTVVENADRSPKFGRKKEKYIAIEVVVKNNSTLPVVLAIEDQVPVSGNEEIEVKVKEYNGADYTSKTGALIWRFNLSPTESKKVRFGYSVTYAKDKVL